MLIFASEDVELADPQALVQANAAFQATWSWACRNRFYPLSQAVIYCHRAEIQYHQKLLSGSQGGEAAPGAQVPMFLRNAPTKLMQEMGYGDGYVYDHNAPDHFAGQYCLPEDLAGETFIPPANLVMKRKSRAAWSGGQIAAKPLSKVGNSASVGAVEPIRESRLGDHILDSMCPCHSRALRLVVGPYGRVHLCNVQAATPTGFGQFTSGLSSKNPTMNCARFSAAFGHVGSMALWTLRSMGREPRSLGPWYASGWRG